MKKNKGLALVMISASLVASLTGCGTVGGALPNADLPVQQYASVQDVMDYYSESMKYGSISTRPAVEEALVDVKYNTVNEGTEAYKKVREAFEKISVEHQKVNGYRINSGLHNYLKSFTDDMVLTDGTIKRVKEYGGYYYLTVSYNTTKNISGSFKNQANYMGIDGIIIKDIYGVETIDEDYLNYIVREINPYLEAVGKPTIENYGVDQSWLDERYEEISRAEQAEQNTEEVENISGEEVDDTVTDDTVTDDTVTDDTLETESVEEQLPNDPMVDSNYGTNVADLNETFVNTKGESVPKVGANNIDRLSWDINLIDKELGTSKEQIAFIPDINMVYNPAGTQGSLNGFGMYNQGKAGLAEFGYTNNELTDPGSIVVTYVFRQNILEPSELDYVFAYVNEYISNNRSIETDAFGGSLSVFLDGTDSISEEAAIKQFTGSNLTVPTFLMDRLEMIVDEFDRAVNNKSAFALMDGTIIEDAGLGMKYAAYTKSADIVTFKSNIKRVVARQGNNYLLEIERTVEDAPKGSGVVGQYRDTYFVVVRQDGTDFRYNDEFLYRRVTTKVPEVEAENTAIRRLVTLNLSGEVDINTATDITNTVLDTMIEAVNNRTSNIFTIFNEDRALLTEDRYNYISSKLVDQANTKGIDTKIELIVKPTEWISGAENQVEFTTKELFKYHDKSGKKLLGGLYVENYYLVSNYGTEWKIDDIITINDKMLEPDEVAEYENMLSTVQAVINENKEQAPVQP